MMTPKLTNKLIELVDANQVLDERIKYELRFIGGKRHATLAWCPAAEEWVATFATASNKVFLNEATAVQWLDAWADQHGGTVLKVACCCDRCASEDGFSDMVKRLTKVSHGACEWYASDMARLVQELKEGVA